MSTDNAVMVAKLIVEDGKKLPELSFQDELVIPMDKGEEIILPFRYLVIDGKVFVSDAVVEYVKENGF